MNLSRFLKLTPVPLVIAGAFTAAAQTVQLPIQQIQSSNVFNLQSFRGVPISSTTNVPVGSDGRAPDPSSGSTGTPWQFQSHVHFGAVVRTTNTLSGSTDPATLPVVLDVPRFPSTAPTMVMSRARVGNPFAARSISFLFGEVITPPEKDEYGVDLSQPNPAKGRPSPIPPSDYWWREPFTLTQHTNGYYYSPHAEKVYASQPGAIAVVWQRTAPSTLQSGAIAGSGNVFTRGASRNVLTNQYVIAATPIQTPRRMYWTEGSFRDTGVPVTIPAERVQGLKIAYNDSVPEKLAAEVVIPGSPPATTIPTTNTVWFDDTVNTLRAYNREGRVLLELLGDLRPEAGPGIREQLGIELIEVSQRPPIDEDVTVELGEPIRPFAGGTPEGTPDLAAQPLLTGVATTFDYRHNVPGTARFDYYAVRETVNENDYLAHWLEESLAGLRWPYRYVRYRFAWPADVARYTHAVRPAAKDLAEAKEMAVPLPSDNAPALVYQDALDQPRAGLTANFAFYSWLTPQQPVHRSLLRFASGQYIRFERIFSWLDETLRSSSTSIESSLANDFTPGFPSLGLGNAYGTSYLGSGVLHLNDALPNQNGHYIVNDFYNNQTVASFRVRFKARIGDGTSPPADGFAFSFGTIPDGTYPNFPAYRAEEGTTNGIAVSFDLWDNTGPGISDDQAPGILIGNNGTNVAGVAIGEASLYSVTNSPQLLPAPRNPVTGELLQFTTGDRFVPVEIVMHPGGAMDVTYDGVKVLNQVPTGFRPRTGRFGFSSRTGSTGYDYQDTFTVGTAARPDGFFGHNNNGAYNLESRRNNPPTTWQPFGNFSFNSGGGTCCGYPGNGNNAGAATGVAQSGGGDFSFTYGLRQSYVVSVDAILPGDRLDISSMPAAGAVISAPGSLSVFFRRDSLSAGISLYNGSVDTSTGAKTGVSGADTAWHNYAVHFDRPNNLLWIYVDGVLKTQLNLLTFAGGIYANYSNAAVGMGSAGGVIWADNFRVGPQSAFAAQWIDDLVIDVNPGLVPANPALASTLAATLDSWVPGNYFLWPDRRVRPFVSEQVAQVGQRLTAPDGEIGGGLDTNYLAGFIRTNQGNLFLPDAYADPLLAGFDFANRGAIIPVNTMPGRDRLEVWWFRPNAVDTTRGFQRSLWPAIVTRYTIQWPGNASEIVLASSDGSGALPSLEATGSVYYQNDPARPGYNPNEEHALMQGGQVYALRDDLNIVSGENYSSAPFVLLRYTEQDGRPAIRPFRVRREKPEAGITFEYNKTAGSILQPPMPLPLLGPAFAPKIAGAPRVPLTQELDGGNIRVSDIGNSPWLEAWQLVTDNPTENLPVFETFPLQDLRGASPITRYFFTTDAAASYAEGIISTNTPFEFEYHAFFRELGRVELTAPNSTLDAFANWIGKTVVISFRAPTTNAAYPVYINNVIGTIPRRIQLSFDNGTPDFEVGLSRRIQLIQPVAGYADRAFDGWRLGLNEALVGSTEGLRDRFSRATMNDRKGNLWVYRGPHLANRPETFAVRYYYNTLPGFHFPSLPFAAQPPTGTPTPYLRNVNAAGEFVGDPVYANADLDQQADGNGLAILYHPAWPESTPVLQMAETLLTPKRGLPAVRGQSSLEVLYQQSFVRTNNINQPELNPARVSVALHDPTREKTIEFDQSLLPGSVKTETSRGKIYFPNLPPHLVKRFFLDPSRGANGALVFAGEFVDAPLGDQYVMLNVAGQKDLESLIGLCLASDNGYARWSTAINSLATAVERFGEDPSRPGTYAPDAVRSVGVSELAQIQSANEAVDSYAITAVGPETGYVSLIAGNGEAFTPEGEPVSIHIFRVSPTLYRGELNVIESDNPLNERLTLQQVVDLGGKTEDYVFEWRVTAPVDGQPPSTYRKTAISLPLAPWSHLRLVRPEDQVAAPGAIDPARLTADVSLAGPVVPVTAFPFDWVTPIVVVGRDTTLGYVVTVSRPALPHYLTNGDRLRIVDDTGRAAEVQVRPKTSAASQSNPATIETDLLPGQASLDAGRVVQVTESTGAGPSSLLFSQFVEPPGSRVTDLWLGASVGRGLGALIYINGGLVARVGFDADNTPGTVPASDLASPRAEHYFRLPSSVLSGGASGAAGRTNRIGVELYSAAAPGTAIDFQIRVEAYASLDLVAADPTVWIPLPEEQFTDGVRAIVGQASDVRSLSDNYLTMRYAPIAAQGDTNRWSQWTEPQLAEGWIKRVLKGINPFNQRITDLYNNAVNTEVSIVAQAGQRWEGDIALSLDSINNYGLIEIYETVLNRGKMLSVGGGINYGPANDALLLAAGYINDLYNIVGNEAAADASNPTIGIGTKDNTYGDIATALFAFKGQLPSLLEEELALLRGRDDFLVPGVETRPVYNRMVWNYTRGIDAGEVVYALNYNVLDQNTDGKVDANDARRLYPQGHGDAYGHYLTALKGYYQLFLDRNFDWVPRSEAVLVLGKPVSVDYQDERKWAASAGAMARAGKQIFDLTWRRDFQSGAGRGWAHLRETRANDKRTRHWGADYWAARTGQGAYLNWLVGNAIVPETDPDPSHRNSIQQVDRTTVPELKELPVLAEGLQTAMDQAEGGLTPLGLPEDAVPFDLNPLSIANGPFTHFEQIYARALGALNNAVAAFDNAKDVTRLMRSEEDSLTEFRVQVEQQELAYTNALIELYGTPYPEDIGPGKTYRTGFVGPDTVHYMYIDNVELAFRDPYGNSLLVPSEDKTWVIDTQTFTADWLDENGISDFAFVQPAFASPIDGTGHTADYLAGTTNYVAFNLSSHGFFKKPPTWVGKRLSPGRVQQAISDVVKARNAAFSAFYNADAAKYDLDWALQSFEQRKSSHEFIRGKQEELLIAQTVLDGVKLVTEVLDKTMQETRHEIVRLSDTAEEFVPTALIVGAASGGDLNSAIRASLKASGVVTESVVGWGQVALFTTIRALETAAEKTQSFVEFYDIATEEYNQELRDATSELRDKVYGMNNQFMAINAALQELDDARRGLQAALAEGERIQAEREIFRRRTAAVIQGYRSRDAAFRIFRNEKLERYKSLFDLAAQYTYMAAKAYDYDTGLLGTARGREFINRIVNSRALGVVANSQPQFAGSNTGDPGLSSVLAEMYADWGVVKTRLGFNNPDAYGTTVSMRYENFRITTNGNAWLAVMNQARRANLLDDPDVRRYCLQIDSQNGAPVPGLVFEFSTTIADGLNLFGKPLAAFDHALSPSSFATKIYAVGVAFPGYVGMDDPTSASDAIEGSGGESPPDPFLGFANPDALAANPYIYLIPVGTDSMRSPALGDTGTIRTWTVHDVTIPLPFNIGGSDFSTKALWQSEDSLSEPLFNIRKHQAFRCISDPLLFDDNTIYSTGGELWRNKFTNTRLIGRSVWNSKWKIVVPGRTLFADPDEGIERFVRTVNDVRIYFQTYSYSGN